MLSSSKTLALYQDQKPHVEELQKSLDEWNMAYDTSDTGEGKTYHVCSLAKEKNYKLVVIAPKTVCNEKWEIVPREYGIPTSNYSYSLVGMGMRGLLVSQTITENNQTIKSFIATEALMNMFDEQTLLVFDEAHYMKNPGTVRLEACSEIVRIAKIKGSKRIYLSATPIDKPQHSISVFRFLGIMKYRKLYQYNRRLKLYEAHGIVSVENLARQMDIRRFRILYTPPTSIHRGNINKYAFKLLSEIILPTIRSGLTSDLALKHDIKNLFIKMAPERREKLFELISELERLERNSTKGFMYKGKITTILKEIEHAKAHEFNRIIHHVLYYPGTKVAMALWYLNSMDIIREYFEAFGLKVLVLKGACSMADRKRIINLFQTPHNEYRLLLLHPTVGGIGIDLHSLSETEQIYGFINANYSIVPLNQTAGRWNRKGQKTKPITRYLYIDNEHTDISIQREVRIMDRLADKTSVLVTAKAVDGNKYPLPGSLSSEFESTFLKNLQQAHI